MDRESRHAGSWYEGTEKNLKQQLHNLFLDKQWGYGEDPLEQSEERNVDPNLIGIVSPHAGYVYSGPIASHGFAELYKRVKKVDTIVILGPNHQGLGAPISIFPDGRWQNPLGSVKIDSEFVEYAKSYNFGSLQNRIGFERLAHVNEHSIDIQLPFLQYLYKNEFEIGPICLGDQSFEPTVSTLSTFLSDYIKSQVEKRILIVASSDFSHENNYDLVVENDRTMLSYLESMNLLEAEQFRQRKRMTICGYAPIFTLIQTAKNLGSPSVEVLKYANSTDIRPGGNYTVGYASILVRST
ncbi:MAG: AmmeMemoRadiSam system protein B [Candidatus Hodarchaeales archaeon]|jgi:AmmeMemoRadiSam system protein B